jgi:3-deoxy-D-manno-octulosonate 8-phosphate phosphatase (KDO 8-P phosphatase)
LKHVSGRTRISTFSVVVSFEIDDGEHRRLGGASTVIRTGGTPMLPKPYHYHILEAAHKSRRTPRLATDTATDSLPRMIKLLILDVDGVLTTGALPYDADGNEVKTFHVQDGGAIRLWQRAGGAVAIVSGRSSPAVDARAKDLGIETVVQGVADKGPAYASICQTHGVSDAEVAVVGDDLVDLPMMRRCGYPIAVDNAAALVKRAARYVTRRRGGEGAVVEAVERLLRINGAWAETTRQWQCA